MTPSEWIDQYLEHLAPVIGLPVYRSVPHPTRQILPELLYPALLEHLRVKLWEEKRVTVRWEGPIMEWCAEQCTDEGTLTREGTFLKTCPTYQEALLAAGKAVWGKEKKECPSVERE